MSAAYFQISRYVDFDTWPEPLWPQCCFGPAYIMTPEAVGKLLGAHEAANNPFLPFEDIYITGVLARAAGVSIINFQDKVFTNYLGKDRFIVHKGLSHWKQSYIDERWEEISIAHFGNATYYKMQNEDKRKRSLTLKQVLVNDMVAEKRKKFFKAKDKQEVLPVKPEEPLKKREEALKKPAQPYMLI